MDDFYKYFQENMNHMGFPTPSNLFQTVTLAAATTEIILNSIDKYGRAVTVGELIVAGTLPETLGFVATISAATYVGVVIGSIAVATQRCLCKGATLADIVSVAARLRLHRPWLSDTLVRWSGVYDVNMIARATYRQQMLHA